MNSFFANTGLIAVSLLILYIIKKLSDHFYLKKASYPADHKIYEAAQEFAEGASYADVRTILASCVDLDEEDTEEILLQSAPHRTDHDGGYGAFIKAVNMVLGEDVYSELYHIH
jgi:hypothetical protein